MTIADEILDFTFSGDPADPIKRHLTGLYSFDHAFETATGEIGMPIGTGYEVFGAKSVGKSTFCYSLISILGNQLGSNLVLADLEGFDPGHFKNILKHNRYKGYVRLVHQGEDEDILEKLADTCLGNIKSDVDYTIGMLDSIAAISPLAEKQGDFGVATYGRRAALLAILSRRLLPTVHPRKPQSENIFFLTNHWIPRVNAKGYISPGGEAKNYLCGLQIHLARKNVSIGGKDYITLPDGSYRLEGTLYKNRYGFDKTKFTVFMKAGVGIHSGLTAMFDALDLKLATRRNIVKIGDESFGHLKTILVKEWKNDEFFQPFYDVLKDNTVLNNSDEEIKNENK